MAKGNNIEKAAENLLREVKTILESDASAEQRCEDAIDYLNAAFAVRKLAAKRADKQPKPARIAPPATTPKTETKLEQPKVEPALAAHAAQANGGTPAAEKRGIFGR